MLKKEVINGKTVITVEQEWFVFKIVNQFEAQEEMPKGYWEWLKLPNRSLVEDSLSFQLDAWNRL